MTAKVQQRTNLRGCLAKMVRISGNLLHASAKRLKRKLKA